MNTTTRLAKTVIAAMAMLRTIQGAGFFGPVPPPVSFRGAAAHMDNAASNNIPQQRSYVVAPRSTFATMTDAVPNDLAVLELVRESYSTSDYEQLKDYITRVEKKEVKSSVSWRHDLNVFELKHEELMNLLTKRTAMKEGLSDVLREADAALSQVIDPEFNPPTTDTRVFTQARMDKILSPSQLSSIGTYLQKVEGTSAVLENIMNNLSAAIFDLFLLRNAPNVMLYIKAHHALIDSLHEKKSWKVVGPALQAAETRLGYLQPLIKHEAKKQSGKSTTTTTTNQ